MKIVIIFQNITALLYFDPINVALVSTFKNIKKPQGFKW